MLLHHPIESTTATPVNSGEKTALVLTGFATIALCYAFSILLIVAREAEHRLHRIETSASCDAPADQQPARPVREGIQSVL